MTSVLDTLKRSYVPGLDYSGGDQVHFGSFVLDKIREELADVLSYSILLADVCGLDLDEIVQAKVKRNAEKYPVEQAYGCKDKYTDLKEKAREVK